ncbi:hypothetical protein [Streptomyces echinatus]|uniref:hypothetical protein n=1 Tax=Streptomyces echinatus TaxID=67293 RepID=UPI00379A103E
MSYVPAEENPATEVPDAEIPSLLLHLIPESADSITELFDQPAQTAVTSRDAVVQLYELLTECFTTPVLMPQLTSDSPDAQLLRRCWDFVDRIVAHSSMHVRGAVYFEVLETAWPYMRDRTRTRTLKMLDTYDVRVTGINRR